MSLPKVNLISNIFNPVGPSAPGGLEVFNYYLARELQRRGVELNLMAAGDSEPMPSLRAIVDKSIMYSKDEKFLSIPWNYRRMTMEEFAIYAKLIDSINDPSIINHFSMVNFLPIYMAVKKNLPVILTMHMATDNFNYKILFDLLSPEEISQIKFVGVSHDQVKEFPVAAEVIFNGVDLDDHVYSDQGRDSYIWIARMVGGKGCEDAISAAQKALVKLEIGGKPNSSEEQEYFNKAVLPGLGDNVKHLGHINTEQKSGFYSARALLFLSRLKESFGLTMIEAMACGTPVIAYDRGPVREIVIDGETGFIVPDGDIDAVAEAINKINGMGEEGYKNMRKRCRQHVEEKFSLQKMVDHYVDLYRELSN